MDNKLEVIILDNVNDFIDGLSIKDQQKIMAAIEALENRKFDSVYIKQISQRIKELRVKKYRLLFFVHQNIIYFIRSFFKKTNKTPKKEIELAEKYYKLYTNN